MTICLTGIGKAKLGNFKGWSTIGCILSWPLLQKNRKMIHLYLCLVLQKSQSQLPQPRPRRNQAKPCIDCREKINIPMASPDNPDNELKIADALEALAQKVDTGFAKVDTQFKGVNARFEDMERRQESMERRQESMEHRQESMERRQESMEHRQESMEHRLGKVESRLGKVESRLGKVENRLEDVAGTLSKGQRELSRKLDQKISGNEVGRALEEAAQDEVQACVDTLRHEAALPVLSRLWWHDRLGPAAWPQIAQTLNIPEEAVDVERCDLLFEVRKQGAPVPVLVVGEVTSRLDGTRISKIQSARTVLTAAGYVTVATVWCQQATSSQITACTLNNILVQGLQRDKADRLCWQARGSVDLSTALTHALAEVRQRP